MQAITKTTSLSFSCVLATASSPQSSLSFLQRCYSSCCALSLSVLIDLSLSHSLSPLPALPAHASLSHSFSPPPYRPCALRLFVPLPSISSLSYHPGCIFSFCCFGCLHPFRGHQHSATMANLTVCWAGELLLLAGVVVLVLDCPLTDHWPQVCPAKRKQVAVE